MTEQERAEWAELKARVSEELAARAGALAVRWGATLDATDGRLLTYLRGVMGNPSAHNLFEQLAVRRFFALLERHGWNAARVRKFFRFYEALRFSGTAGRTRYRLTPVQCFQFGSIFGFDDGDGARLCQTAYIFVPRKFSKTTGAASLAVYDLLFGDNNAQAYVGANSYEQAKICFDEIRAIMRDLDPSERRFRVNREKITYRCRGRDSLVRCLTGNAKTQDGLFASLVIMDEYAQARDTATRGGADLKNVLTTSMGPRREPLVVVISTASEVVDGPFYHELQGVKAILRGEREDDTVFASLFMPDAGDREDDPATWAKVQPHLGVTVRPDYYKREYARALLSADNMTAFRTKLLNVFTAGEARVWFSFDKARSLLGDFDIDRVAGAPLTAVAFDLSVHDDFSAVSYSFYDSSDRKFRCHTDYYIPAGTVAGHPNAELYRRWHAAGHLNYCEGDVIDVRRIADDILRRSAKLRIVRIGYDAYKAQELVALLSSAGGASALVPYSQTYGSFNLPVESFEMLAWSEPPRIVLNDNPINAYCLTNCVIDADRLENKKPMKAAAERKIDGVITMLMTLGQLYSYKR